MVLLTGPAGAAWHEAAKRTARGFTGLEMDVHSVGGPALADPDGRFCDAYGIEPDGACLVRPDGVVAWRTRTSPPDREPALAHALGAVLDRGAESASRLRWL
jgi:putative polyketide hydroxylase